MRSMIRNVCVGLVFVYSSAARPELIRGSGNGGLTDVGPEAGVVFGRSILFRNKGEVLVTSGRAGVYKTVDSGKSWVRRMQGLVNPAAGVEPYAQSLCQAPSAPDIVFAVTIQDGISRTTDFGESWESPTRTNNPQLADCDVDPLDPLVVYALTSAIDPLRPGVLFKSLDGGLSFVAVGDGLPGAQSSPFSVAVAPTDPQTVYVAIAAQAATIYRSSDGGLNFDPLPNAPQNAGRVYPHPSADATLIVTTFGTPAADVFLSTDFGASFARVGAGLPPVLAYALAFDPADASVIYAAARENGVYRSTDGALTFERLEGLSERDLLGLGATNVAVSPSSADCSAAIYVGTSLGPYRSDDGGKTFVPIHDGYRGTQVNDLAIDAAGRLLVATINTAGVFRSTEIGTYEIIGDTLPRDVATSLQAVAAAPDDPDLYLVATNLFFQPIFRTTDGGQTWSNAPIMPTPIAGSRMRIAFAPTNANRVYAVSFGGLARSDDGGRMFERLLPLSLGSIAVDPVDPNIIYVSNLTVPQGLYKSTDGGRSLQQVAVGDYIAIAIDPEHPQTIYAASRTTNLIIRSRDGGQTFSPVVEGLGGDRALGLGIDPQRPARLFVWMHAGGLFRSEDGADSWTADDSDEARRRSTAQAGTTALVIAPEDPARVYFGNGSVLQFVNQ